MSLDSSKKKLRGEKDKVYWSGLMRGNLARPSDIYVVVDMPEHTKHKISVGKIWNPY